MKAGYRKQRTAFTEAQGVAKYDGPIFDVCGPKFIKFWDSEDDPSRFPTSFLVVYGMFLSEDICH